MATPNCGSRISAEHRHINRVLQIYFMRTIVGTRSVNSICHIFDISSAFIIFYAIAEVGGIDILILTIHQFAGIFVRYRYTILVRCIQTTIKKSCLIV